MNTQDPTTWFYAGALVVLLIITLRWFGVRRRVREVLDTPPKIVEPLPGAPRYVNRYEPPELVASIQEAINHRHTTGAWPDGLDDQTAFVIERQLARCERQREKGDPVG